MPKATVYRIENQETKRGMYGNVYSLYDAMRETGNDIWLGDDPHPAPWQDSKLLDAGFPRYNFSHLHFGFASIDQLRNWIYNDRWLELLHENGYVLAIVESEEVYVGNTQAVFLRPEEYQTVSIKEYFNL